MNLSLVGPDSSALSLGVRLTGLLISTCLVFAIARRLSPGRRAFPLLAAATSYLGSTLDFLPSMRPLRVLLSSSMPLIAGAIGLWGLLGLLSPGAHVEAEERRSARAILVALLVLYGGSLVPTIALGKVSELYAYSQLPFVALILGYLLVLGWERLPVSGLGARCAAWVAVLSVALWMAVGVGEKVDLAVRPAARSRQIFVGLEGKIGEMPSTEPLILCPERAGAAGPVYSIFFRSDAALAAQMIPYLSWRHPERQIRMESTRDCTPLPVEPRRW